MKFPHLARELVAELDRLVPERVPEPGDDMVTIQRHAAKRELVLFLKRWMEQSALTMKGSARVRS